jgi:hypothetical protein
MPLVRCKAVQKPVAQRSAQGGLRAAARRMGRVPGIALAPAAAIVMSDHRSAVAVARPSAARRIIALRKQCPISVTAGQDVMPGRCDISACLRECRVSGEIHTLAMEVLNARGNLNALRVDPRASTDPVACVDRRRISRWRCAEVGTPPSIAASDGHGTLQANGIRSGETAQVAAKAAAGAGHKERHSRRDRGRFLCGR